MASNPEITEAVSRLRALVAQVPTQRQAVVALVRNMAEIAHVLAERPGDLRDFTQECSARAEELHDAVLHVPGAPPVVAREVQREEANAMGYPVARPKVAPPAPPRQEQTTAPDPWTDGGPAIGTRRRGRSAPAIDTSG